MSEENGENLSIDLTTESEWHKSGTRFRAQTRADMTKVLPPGVYRYNSSMMGWWLDRISPAFTFPVKVYDASSNIINRIVTHWQVNGGNLGVLMNGLRGAGKTMTAQLLANKLIEEHNVPVLLVKNPIPLQIVLDSVQQNIMIIFDEFEKTHDDEAQQQLLSVIDGTSRSKHSRLVVFTTNATAINENFRDRPSRIHYRFEFQRVADEIIEGLVNDSLPDDLSHLRPDIFQFLNSRKICTIDIVKAVIREVVAFRESPLEFEELLNIAEGEPPSFRVDIVNADTGVVVRTVSKHFRPDRSMRRFIPLLTGNKYAVEEFVEGHRHVRLQTQGWEGSTQITLLEKCPEDNMWLAHVQLPLRKTVWREFDFILGGGSLWLDAKPDDWKIPFGRKQVDEDSEAYDALYELYERSCSAGTVYGTGAFAVFKISITANSGDEPAYPPRYTPTSDASGILAD